MQTIVNKRLKRLLSAMPRRFSAHAAGDVRAWAAAFGDVECSLARREPGGSRHRHSDPDRAGQLSPPSPGL